MNNSNHYPEYDVDYISGCMSLRPPQKRSLKILADILDEIEPSKDLDLQKALYTVHDSRPTVTSFERDFMSLAFALATGVGKTRLMGAFITYLYAVKGIKNFFVVAPNITIYDKLVKELSDINHPKYVFKGIGIFAQVAPHIISGDNYQQAGYTYGYSDCNINVFNIAKFNKELGNIKKLSEFIGASYFNYLSSLPDLVILMDESHHYRAEKGMEAINDLKPILGLELTATPQVEKGTTTVKFKNVVYEYPLSRAIADGYAKIPFAMTRRDIADLKFSPEDKDKMMLSDGILNHERVKAALVEYAQNSGKKPVKPFVLVVCKDTEHAETIFKYINSDNFYDGAYKNTAFTKKTIILHSNQRGVEKDEYVRELLEVEKFDNPVEIVIHVNILKEGWDVNNLYTIVPLRTAASKTLREQTIGRGLRLPYGERTGDSIVDRLVITAHDNFEQIVREANDPNSLLKAGNIIYAEDIIPTETVVSPSVARTLVQGRIEEVFSSIETTDATPEEKEVLRQGLIAARDEVAKSFGFDGTAKTTVPKTDAEIIATITENVDLGKIVESRTDFSDIYARFLSEEVKKAREIIESQTMAIPQISIKRDGKTNYCFKDFDLDTSEFNYSPISNDIQYQDLITRETEIIESTGIGLTFQVDDPYRVIVRQLIQKPEVDYDECGELIQKLVVQCVEHIKKNRDFNDVKNIVMFYKFDIADKIYEQMKKHFEKSEPDIIEQVNGVSHEVLEPGFTRKKGEASVTLYDPIDDGKISSYIFTDFKKALHLHYKFDSMPEKRFAIVCETDKNVMRWLRPAPKQFNLTYFYQGTHNYEPDFVVETENCMYLVEVKGEDKLNAPEVLAKKERAIKYCKAANVYCSAHGLKLWKHLFIPSAQITTTSSFNNLAERFEAK